jgi:hypothetical protein
MLAGLSFIFTRLYKPEPGMNLEPLSRIEDQELRELILDILEEDEDLIKYLAAR